MINWSFIWTFHSFVPAFCGESVKNEIDKLKTIVSKLSVEKGGIRIGIIFLNFLNISSFFRNNYN